jgi:hypothetical protein
VALADFSQRPFFVPSPIVNKISAQFRTVRAQVLSIIAAQFLINANRTNDFHMSGKRTSRDLVTDVGLR